MKYFPLSQAQKRIWYSQKKHRGVSLYNIGGTVQISGIVNLAVLKSSIESVYWSNEALRLQFCEEENEVLQYITENNLYIDEIDFSIMDNSEAVFAEWCKEQAGKPFHMMNERLCYFAVFRLNADTMGYFIKIHHILADGWSIKLLTDQVKMAYEQIIHGGKEKLECKPSYLNYVKQEEQYLVSKTCKTAGNYWKKMFWPLPEQSQKSIRVEDIQGNRKTFFFEEDIQKKLEEYLKKNNLSVHSFFLCVAIIYEYKVSGSEDIVLGTPLLGRSGRIERQTFGTFTNTMPFRYNIQRDETVQIMLKSVAAKMHEIFRYQKFPYNFLQNELELNRNGIDSLYCTCINYYNTEICSDIDGLQATNTEFYNGYQDYPLQIIVRKWNGLKYQVDFDYQQKKYSAEQIENIFKIYKVLMSQILINDSAKIKDILLVDFEQKNRLLYKYNETCRTYPKSKTIIDLFGLSIKKYPSRIAISKGNIKLNYAEFGDMVNTMAHALRNNGVQPEDHVIIAPEYTINSIAAILSILKCGAVYIPLDLKAPKERKRRIIERVKPKCILTENEEFDDNTLIINISDLCQGNSALKEINYSDAQKLAYILFTSGTTGMPKGVMVKNYNLVNYLVWAENTYIKKDKEVFPLFSSFAFDFSLTSIFLPLVTGNELRLYENSRKTNILKEILEEGIVSIIKMTPSQVPLMKGVERKDSKLHTIIFGGEELRSKVCQELIHDYGNGICIYNEYGPTEATVGCMIYRYKSEDTELTVPIGQPINNVQIYVLDKDRKPLPPNIIGEIYIGGEGVAAGYFESEDETRRSFIKDDIRGEGTLYKSGDLAFHDADNNVIFCGRIDRQAKIRGYRIELYEIERCILSSGLVNECYVDIVDRGENKELCVYAAGMAENKKQDLINYLSLFLPDYMVPNLFVLLKEFPINDNGKIDVKQLSYSAESVQEKAFKGGIVYKILLDNIKALIPENLFSPDKNFYEMGGDSIKAILLSSRLFEEGYILSVTDILSHPELEEMSLLLQKKVSSIYKQGIASGPIYSTGMINWFLQKKFSKSGHYNFSLFLEWKQNLPFSAVNECFVYMIRHHDGLRINVKPNMERLFYNNEHLKRKKVLETIDCVNENISIEKIIKEKTSSEFNLCNDLLIRPYLIITKTKKFFYILIHHLISDGFSVRIFMDDFQKLLLQASNKEKKHLAEKTLSYKEYARLRKKNEIFDGKVKEKNENDDYMVRNIDFCNYGNTKLDKLTLNRKKTNALLETASDKFGVNAEELLFFIIIIAYCNTLRKKDLLIDIERHGRDVVSEIDVSRTIGWFTMIHCFEIHVLSSDIHGQLKEVKEQIRYLLKKEQNHFQSRGEVRFNYLGDFLCSKADMFSMKQNWLKEDVDTQNEFAYIVDVNIYVWNGKLNISVRYRKNCMQMKKFIENINVLLLEIFRACTNENKYEYSPSDFDMVELSQEDVDRLTQ